MRHPMTTRIALLALTLGAWTVSAAPDDAAKGARSSRKVEGSPRTSDDRPDMTGRWNYSTRTPLEREPGLPPYFLEKDVAQFRERILGRGRRGDGQGLRGPDGKPLLVLGGAPQPPPLPAYNDFWTAPGHDLVKVIDVYPTSLVVDPSDGRVPALTADGLKRAQAVMDAGSVAARAENRPAMERCLLGFNTGPPLIPGGYNNNVEIVQSATAFVLLTENVHSARIFSTNGRPHSSHRRWLGDSRGRWEGETFVVDSINFLNAHGSTDPRVHGDGGGPNFHLVERFAMVDKNTVVYRATLDDPDMWSKPWTVEFTLIRTQDPVMEYACHEGNHALPNGLSGLRAMERKAAEGTRK